MRNGRETPFMTKKKLGIVGLIALILAGLTRLLAQQADPADIKKEAEK
jgi:hypothetical protein